MAQCRVFFFSSRRRHTRLVSDWSSDVCSSDLSCRSITFASSGRRGSGRTSETERLGHAVARLVRRPSSKYARPNSGGAASTSPYGANAFSVSGSATSFMRPPGIVDEHHGTRGAPRLRRGATNVGESEGPYRGPMLRVAAYRGAPRLRRGATNVGESEGPYRGPSA